ncbi:hypothetical protein ACJX0J_039031, partial [Zea mays]
MNLRRYLLISGINIIMHGELAFTSLVHQQEDRKTVNKMVNYIKSNNHFDFIPTPKNDDGYGY